MCFPYSETRHYSINHRFYFIFFQVPDIDEVKVQNLQAGRFVEDKENNTFAVNFKWDPPSFRLRDILSYNLSFELSGYERDQFRCLGAFKKGSECKISGLVSMEINF